VTVIENFAPGFMIEREDVNLGPLTYVTLCGEVSSLLHMTCCPTLAWTADGVKSRLFITTCTVPPASAPEPTV
jgi:hypothetical protein